MPPSRATCSRAAGWSAAASPLVLAQRTGWTPASAGPTRTTSPPRKPVQAFLHGRRNSPRTGRRQWHGWRRTRTTLGAQCHRPREDPVPDRRAPCGGVQAAGPVSRGTREGRLGEAPKGEVDPAGGRRVARYRDDPGRSAAGGRQSTSGFRPRSWSTMASGSHKRWGEAPARRRSFMFIPRSRGRVLRHLGVEIEEAVELLVDNSALLVHDITTNPTMETDHERDEDEASRQARNSSSYGRLVHGQPRGREAGRRCCS